MLYENEGNTQGKQRIEIWPQNHPPPFQPEDSEMDEHQVEHQEHYGGNSHSQGRAQKAESGKEDYGQTHIKDKSEKIYKDCLDFSLRGKDNLVQGRHDKQEQQTD